MIITVHPGVVIIDTKEENSPLVTEFLMEYSASSKDTLSTSGPMGDIALNDPFESSLVKTMNVVDVIITW